MKVIFSKFIINYLFYIFIFRDVTRSDSLLFEISSTTILSIYIACCRACCYKIKDELKRLPNECNCISYYISGIIARNSNSMKFIHLIGVCIYLGK